MMFEYFICIFSFLYQCVIFLNCVNLINHYIKILIHIYRYVPLSKISQKSSLIIFNCFQFDIFLFL